MTTPLFLLRCVQLGISIRDLDLLTIGMVNDMYVESGNDQDAAQSFTGLSRRYSLKELEKVPKELKGFEAP